jgi:hypothetical protein
MSKDYMSKLRGGSPSSAQDNGAAYGTPRGVRGAGGPASVPFEATDHPESLRGAGSHGGTDATRTHGTSQGESR